MFLSSAAAAPRRARPRRAGAARSSTFHPTCSRATTGHLVAAASTSAQVPCDQAIEYSVCGECRRRRCAALSGCHRQTTRQVWRPAEGRGGSRVAAEVASHRRGIGLGSGRRPLVPPRTRSKSPGKARGAGSQERLHEGVGGHNEGRRGDVRGDRGGRCGDGRSGCQNRIKPPVARCPMSSVRSHSSAAPESDKHGIRRMNRRKPLES